VFFVVVYIFVIKCGFAGTKGMVNIVTKFRKYELQTQSTKSKKNINKIILGLLFFRNINAILCNLFMRQSSNHCFS